MKNRVCMPILFILLSRVQPAFTMFQVDSPANALTVHCDRKPLRNALKTVSDQTGIGFVFQDDLVNGLAVSCDIDSLPVDLALDRILAPAGISFRKMQDGLIVLYNEKTACRIIRGWVVDASNGNGLPDANILQEGTTRGTTSGVDGHFTLRTNDPDPCTIRVSYIGFHPEQVLIQEKTDSLKVVMQEKPLEGKTVTVESGRYPDLELAGKNGRMSFAPGKTDFIPSAGGNNFERTLQLLPGIGGAYDRPAQLSIDGGPESETLIYLDGIPLFQSGPYYGLLAPFHPRTVENVTVWKDAYPAHLGDALSGIVELTGNTVPKGKFNAGAGVDMFGSNAFMEWPVTPKLHIFLAGRVSHRDITNGRYYRNISDYLFLNYRKLPGNPLHYNHEPRRLQVDPMDCSFRDLTGKISFRPWAHDDLAATFILDGQHYEYLQYPLYPFGWNDTLSYKSGFENKGVSFNWNHQWNPRMQSGVLFVHDENLIHMDYIMNHYDYINDGPHLRERRLQWDNQLELRWLSLRSGIEITRRNSDYRHQWWSRSPSDTSANSLYPVMGKWSRYRGDYRTLYSEFRISPLSGFNLDFGLRATAMSVKTLKPFQQNTCDPRVSADWAFAGNWCLEAGWGRTRQFLYRFSGNEEPNTGSNGSPYIIRNWTLHDKSYPPRTAENSRFRIRYASSSFSMGIEAFHKYYPDLIWHPLIQDAGPFGEGRGVSKGIELTLERKRGPVTGWMSYRLGRTDYWLFNHYHILSTEYSRPPGLDREHEFKSVAQTRLGSFCISLSGVFASGKPYTLQGLTGHFHADGSGEAEWVSRLPWSGTRLPPYQRLDVQISKTFNKILGLNWEISLAALNVTNRRNIWFRQFDDEISHITNLPYPSQFTEVSNVISDVPMLGFTPVASLGVSLN